MSNKIAGPVSSRFLTTGQIAKLCKVAPRTVSKWIDGGRLKGFRLPGSKDRRVSRDDLVRFLQEYGFPAEIVDQLDTAQHLFTMGLPTDFSGRLAKSLGPGWSVSEAVNAFALGGLLASRIPAVVVLGPLVPQSEALAVAGQLRRVSDRVRLVVLVPEDVGDVEAYHEAGFEVVLPWTGDVGAVVGEVVK